MMTMMRNIGTCRASHAPKLLAGQSRVVSKCNEGTALSDKGDGKRTFT